MIKTKGEARHATQWVTVKSALIHFLHLHDLLMLAEVDIFYPDNLMDLF